MTTEEQKAVEEAAKQAERIKLKRGDFVRAEKGYTGIFLRNTAESRILMVCCKGNGVPMEAPNYDWNPRIATEQEKSDFIEQLRNAGYEWNGESLSELRKPSEPDVNAELLSALKETDKDLCVLESTMLQIEQRDHLAEGMTELVKSWRKRNKQAISNYEKQQ